MTRKNTFQEIHDRIIQGVQERDLGPGNMAESLAKEFILALPLSHTCEEVREQIEVLLNSSRKEVFFNFFQKRCKEKFGDFIPFFKKKENEKESKIDYDSLHLAEVLKVMNQIYFELMKTLKKDADKTKSFFTFDDILSAEVGKVGEYFIAEFQELLKPYLETVDQSTVFNMKNTVRTALRGCAGEMAVVI